MNEIHGLIPSNMMNHVPTHRCCAILESIDDACRCDDGLVQPVEAARTCFNMFGVSGREFHILLRINGALRFAVGTGSFTGGYDNDGNLLARAENGQVY